MLPSFLLLTGLAAAGATPKAAPCNLKKLDNTTYNYLVQSDDTIFTIADKTGRGVCDIARANRMADAEVINVGVNMTIPPQSCDFDSTSCLITLYNGTADCVNGGPHTYTTFPNDTITKISSKLQITTESIINEGMLDSDDVDAVIETDKTIKIPQCYPSTCEMQPFSFVWGVYLDLANEYGSTVGQIMALNPQYNYSVSTGYRDTTTDGPVVTLPINCTQLASNVSVIG